MRFITLILGLLIFQSCNSQTEKDRNITIFSGIGEKIQGNREIIKIKKNVGNFTKISTGSFVDVVLTEGKVGEITIEGESNIVDLVDVESRSETLYVGVKKNKNISTKKGIIVYIPVDKITSILSSGSGDVFVKKDLNVSSFILSNSGSGDVVLKKVKADDFTIKASGSGDILLQNLTANNTDIQLKGSCDIKMEINSKITKANISGSSDLLLTGKTQDFKVEVSGSSDIKVDEFIAENVDVSVSGSGTIVLYANKTVSASVSGSGDVYYKGNAQLIGSKVSGSGAIKKL